MSCSFDLRPGLPDDFMSFLGPAMSKDCELHATNFLIVHEKGIDLGEHVWVEIGQGSDLGI